MDLEESPNTYVNCNPFLNVHVYHKCILLTSNFNPTFLFSAVPSAPRDFRGTDVTSTSATLEWKAPEKDGGAPITDYVIERREKTYGPWRSEATIKAPTLTHGVKRLIEGTDYYFRVCAENAEGKGPWTEIEDAVKPSKEKSMYMYLSFSQ